jgi:hypothetical protein
LVDGDADELRQSRQRYREVGTGADLQPGERLRADADDRERDALNP